MMDPATTVTRWYWLCTEPADFRQCQSCIRNAERHPSQDFAPHQRWHDPVLDKHSRTCHDWMPGTPT